MQGNKHTERNHDQFVKEFYGDHIKFMQEQSLKEFSAEQNYQIKSEFSVIPPWVDKKEIEQREQKKKYEQHQKEIEAKLNANASQQKSQVYVKPKKISHASEARDKPKSEQQPQKEPEKKDQGQSQEQADQLKPGAESHKEDQAKENQMQHMDGCKNKDAIIVFSDKIDNLQKQEPLSCDVYLATGAGIMNDSEGKPCEYGCDLLGTVDLSTKECKFGDQLYFLVNLDQFMKEQQKVANELQLVFVFSEEIEPNQQQKQAENKEEPEEVQYGFAVHQVYEKGKVRQGKFKEKMYKGKIEKYPIKAKSFKQLPHNYHFEIKIQSASDK